MWRPGVAVLTVLAIAALTEPAGAMAGSEPQAAMPGLRQVLPPDLPLDRDGLPTRPLSDAELYRLLLALSAVNQPAAARITACHAAGTPYGHPAWRSCATAR
jgi:hypothetical protein